MESYSAQIIRSVRKSLKINQTALCKELGISQGTLSKLENGILEIHALEWIAFCDKFLIDPNVLTKGFVTFLPEVSQVSTKKGSQIGAFKVPAQYSENANLTLHSLFPVLNNLHKNAKHFENFRSEFAESFNIDPDYLFILDHPINESFMAHFLAMKTVKALKLDFKEAENFKYYNRPKSVRHLLQTRKAKNIEDQIDIYINHFASYVFQDVQYKHSSKNKTVSITAPESNHNLEPYQKYQLDLLADFLSQQEFELPKKIYKHKESHHLLELKYA